MYQCTCKKTPCTCLTYAEKIAKEVIETARKRTMINIIIQTGSFKAGGEFMQWSFQK